MGDQRMADELQDRLIRFAVAIIGATNRLPRTMAGRHLSSQMIRSGTSPAPNYGEARGAESRADFQHKLSIVLKELNETAIWLRIARESHLLDEAVIAPLISENDQLSRIITASLRTVRQGGIRSQLPPNEK